jgi:N utilization substance protein B
MNKGLSKYQARTFAMQFLYQCEREKIFYFNPAEFSNFSNNFSVHARVAESMQRLVDFCFAHLPTIDATLESASQNWKLSRMCSIDRAVLRLATAELALGQTPKKVVINEAIEIAKEYGTENSGRFVNGILDKIASRDPIFEALNDLRVEVTSSDITEGDSYASLYSSTGPRNDGINGAHR